VIAAERYKTDPYFHQLVDLFLHQFMESHESGAALTPSEVREASSLAWQIYIERYQPHPYLVPGPR
jgi:hypothetical protein